MTHIYKYTYANMYLFKPFMITDNRLSSNHGRGIKSSLSPHHSTFDPHSLLLYHAVFIFV